MDVSKRIRIARKHARLTQDQVAELLGITKGAVSQWESGKTEPRNDLLRKFATITGKPLNWLMGFDSPAGFADAEAVAHPRRESRSVEAMISVYAYTAVEKGSEMMIGDVPVFSIACPPQLLGVKGVYAVLVSCNRMAPRYEEGEVILIDPTRHARVDDYIVARLRGTGSGPELAVIGKLVRYDSHKLAIRQLNPDMVLYYPAQEVVSLELIVISSAIR